MHEERLIERIQSSNRSAQRREKLDPRRMIDSIVQHLERILNTRRGSAPIADDFGIPDFTDFRTAYPDSQRDLEREIRQTIQKYEPRLQAIRVKFAPHETDLLSISFQIVGRMVIEESKDSIIFHGIMDADGKIRMRQ